MKKLKKTIEVKIYRRVFIEEDARWIEFVFTDGKMSHTRQSTSYYKSRDDWEFYGNAILAMLKITKEWYTQDRLIVDPQKPKTEPNPEDPF